MITIATRPSIPDAVLDKIAASSEQHARLVGHVRSAASTGSQERIELAEQALARHAYETALRSDRPRNAAIIMRLVACMHGAPYGAHDVWLDRSDISDRTGNPPTHVNALMRRGVFDLLEYGHNELQRAAKRYATSESVERYLELRNQGHKPAEIETLVSYASVSEL